MSLIDFEPYKVAGIELPLKCLYYKYINGFAVPCGKCEFCRRQKAREWAFRLEQESFDKYCYNCLLTYRDEDLPYHNGKPSVNKVHVQEFLKRFRYHVQKHYGAKFKFFLCGEYGGHNHRPHYHMIIFTDFRLTNRGADPYRDINEILMDSWKHGIADIEPIQSVGGSVSYLTTYMTSYYDGMEYDEHSKPFLQMSRCGLGKSWIERHPNQVVKMQDDMDYTTVSNGHKLPLPRYLRRKIMPEEQQIARADAFFDYSINFKLINDNHGRKKAIKRQSIIEEQRAYQREREREDYRKGKIHANNSNTSKLSYRAKTAEERKATPRPPCKDNADNTGSALCKLP